MYILVTPAKNEFDNIQILASSILKQTVKPIIWLIVNDGSEDGTECIIQKLTSEYSWIKSLNLDAASHYDWLRYGYVVNSGFIYLINICNQNSISYDFLGIVDADISLRNDYFEILITKMNDNPNIGIISGTLYIRKNGIIVPEDNDTRPRGGARLYNKFCFEDIDGFSNLPSPDSVSDIKAKNRGWHLYRENSAKGLHNRKSSSSQGLWKGYAKMGKGRYFVNYHPYNSILTGLFLTMKPPFYLGIAFMHGYFKDWIIKCPKTSDKEVSDYYWQSWSRLKERSLKVIINLL